jgi:hypothetical protein
MVMAEKAKYRYMIQGVGYGGELVVGEVNAAFVEYWQPIVEEEGDSDLVEALFDGCWDDDEEPDDALLDPESPPLPTEDFVPGDWYDIDNFEHSNSTFADSYLEVYQIDDNDLEIDGTNVRLNISDHDSIYSRECYFGEERDDSDEVVPVLSMMSSEKGGFWNVVLELDEPFDPKLLAFGSLESNLCELTDAVFYNGVELDMEYDFCDTTGKGTYAAVGYLNKKWHDAVITPEHMQEMIADWRECLED